MSSEQREAANDAAAGAHAGPDSEPGLVASVEESSGRESSDVVDMATVAVGSLSEAVRITGGEGLSAAMSSDDGANDPTVALATMPDRSESPAPTSAVVAAAESTGVSAAPPPRKGLSPLALGGIAVVVVGIVVAGLLASGSKESDAPSTAATEQAEAAPSVPASDPPAAAAQPAAKTPPTAEAAPAAAAAPTAPAPAPPSDSQIEAKAAEMLANKAKTLEEKVEYLAPAPPHARRLAPENIEYRQRLAEARAQLEVQGKLAARHKQAKAAAKKAKAAHVAKPVAKPKPSPKPKPKPKPKADDEVAPQFAD